MKKRITLIQKPKKKKVLSEKQLKHLERMRQLASEKRQEKAKAKQLKSQLKDKNEVIKNKEQEVNTLKNKIINTPKAPKPKPQPKPKQQVLTDFNMYSECF
jgi:hypothetical protein